MGKEAVMANAKVLIVDDEADVLSSTQLLLQVLGYRGITISDPALALGAAREEKPALILLDVRIAGYDVRTLIADLHRDGALASIPIVLFSADPDLATLAAELDVDGYLHKPFSKQALESLLVQMVPAATHVPSAPAPAPTRPAQPSIASALNDYWNVFAATNTYAQALLAQPDLKPENRRAAEELEKALLRLERAATELHTLFGATLVQKGGHKPPSP